MFAWRDQYLSFNGPSGPATDPYWSYVSLLENFEYPETAFVDSSSNNFLITVNGDTKPSLKTPFNGGSVYFDGTGDYLTVPSNSAFNINVTQWTIEAWVWPANTTGTKAIAGIFAGGVGGWYMGLNGAVTRFSSGFADYNFGSISASTWTHLAAVRNGNNLTFYINGTQSGSSVNITAQNWDITNALWIGNINTSGWTMNGYISNFRLVKGTAVYTSNFTPPSSPLTAITDTQLLVLNSAVDSSPNSFTITTVGDTKSSQNGPYYLEGGSLYFDGTGDYITCPDSDEFYFTGDFTLEAWVYMTTTTGRRTIVCQWPGINATYCAWVMEVNASNRVTLSYGVGSTNAQVTGTSLTVLANVWNHVAITRSGTTVRLFCNGIQDATTGTVSGALNNSPGYPVNLGRNGDNSNYLTGFISNCRVIKGTALYTTDFTPSTTPLTNVAGTSLLVNGTNQGLLRNNTYIDSATTATAALTISGSPRYSGLSPFTNTIPGSISLGSGNYLSMPANAKFNLSSNNFTFEAWIYMTNLTLQSGYFPIVTWGTGAYKTFRVRSTGINFESPGGSYSNTALFPSTMVVNTWYHIALVRSSSSTVTAYLNGVAGTPITNLTTTNTFGNSTEAVAIGYKSDPQYFYGYISNWRLTGAALYTSNFTVPTTNLGMAPNTISYVNGYIAGMQDLSSNGQQITTTTANNQISTQQKKFGTQSISYTATGYQNVTNSSTLIFGTGDFTIEGWVYRNATGVAHTIICKGTSTTGWLLQINSSNQLTWTNGTTVLKTSTTTIPANTWTYFAITRTGTAGYMFINGEDQGIYSNSVDYNQTNNMIIGADRSLTNGLTGYLDDIRVTNGVCRYTASFTAPTSAFPTTG